MQSTQDRPQAPPQQQTNIRPLGFGPSPSGMAIFCNRSKTDTWYTLDQESQPVELPYPALTGYLQSIEFIKGEYKGKPKSKLRFKMMAHRPCTLEAGSESTFTKGFLSAIARLTPEQLRSPIIIEATPSEQEDKVLFCTVWMGGQKVRTEWDEKTDWREVARKAKANVAQLQRD